MSLDRCVPPVSHTVVSASPRPVSRLVHHVGSRHFHRLRHAKPASTIVSRPAYGCGKHFADDKSGNLAARPTDGGPPLKTVAGKAAVAKLAVGGTTALLGAAAVAGALAMSSSGSSFPFGGAFLHGQSRGSPVLSVSAVSTPGSESQPSPAVLGAAPVSGASSVGPIATPVPEPSSLALLAGFATLTSAFRILRRVSRKNGEP